MRKPPAVPTGGLNALHFIRKANIQRREKVLINGAAGNIGTFAVQLAKHYGAEVTGVDSTDKMDMLRSIGTDHVIDYTQEDFTKNGETYDVIFDVVGESSFSRSTRSLEKNGRYLLVNPRLLPMARGLWTWMISSKKVIFEFASYKTEDLVFLKELIEAGKIRSVIDKRYPLEAVAEAHRYVDNGQKKGKCRHNAGTFADTDVKPPRSGTFLVVAVERPPNQIVEMMGAAFAAPRLCFQDEELCCFR